METIKQETYEEARAREQKEEEANLARLLNIAKILNLTVAKDESGYTRAWVKGIAPEGFKVYLTANQYHCKGKVNASIGWETETQGVKVWVNDNEKIGDINEALTKTDEVIAGNIAKRIFPQARTTQTRLDGAILEAVANKNNHDKNLGHMAKILGVKVSEGRRDERSYINEYHKFANANVEVKADSDGNEFNIDLKWLNFRQAKAVLTALKSIK